LELEKVTSLEELLDGTLESWVDSANDPATDFPIQNLPFCRFRRPGGAAWCIGVGIGDQVLDLRLAKVINHDDIEKLMRAPASDRLLLRDTLVHSLQKDSGLKRLVEPALLPQKDVVFGLPCDINNYTDFYVGIHHATAVGKLFRPDNPLLPNYKWMPIGYHGRASTVTVSGQDVRRPFGQVKAPNQEAPVLQPSGRLDIELELGLFVGAPNAQGSRIPLDKAEGHIFGITLLNDWSARDIQAWEYQPLGPFLSKNFATTVSPWIVPMESLVPFRKPWGRPAGDPPPLEYLAAESNAAAGAIDVQMEVWLQTARMREEGHTGDRISRSNYADAAYWTAAQLIAHHTVNGCALRTGDLLGTGTLSGPTADEAGSLLELSNEGKNPIRLSSGEERTFLHDGDTVTLRGFCEKPGYRRIGFGECRATILPAT